MSYEDARAEREFRMNPPSSAPGQGSDDDWNNMAIGSSSVESISDSYQSDINSTLNNMNGSQQLPAQNQQGTGLNGYFQPGKPVEDRLFDAVELGGKGLIVYLKALVNSLRNNTSADWHMLGQQICLFSLGGIAIGIIGCVIKLIARNNNRPTELMIGSLMSLIVGLVLCFKFRMNEGGNTVVEEVEPVSEPDWSSFSDNDFDDDDGYNFDDSGDSDEDTDWDKVLSEIEDSESFSTGSNPIDSESFDVDEAVDKLPEIRMGTQTRSYLLEAYMSILPTCTPGYSSMSEISPDDNMFFDFENLIRSAATQVGMKEENLPELTNLYENPFIYRLNCTRPTGMKEQLIADEVANTFSRDSNNMLVRFGVYATVETSTGVCSINLFKGFTEDALGNQVGGVRITLGDVYRTIGQFVGSPDIEFPFVWGINELGKTLYCDMKDNNSIIICGEPRGGKSWKGQSILAQFAMFHSPKEVQFYVLDNKDLASDYRYPSMVLPHIRYFCGDPDKINESLEKIINYMMNTNGKKMADAGVINIKDYNHNHPEEKLPYRYVVIDELQALMDHFEKTGQKEEAAKFRGYLSTIVSKLPYTGLRLILFPHRIVDQIISKNTYSLVSARAVVNQLDGKLVEASVGVSESKFGHKLAQKGDMAIRLHELNGGEACFCHAEVLTFSNDTNKKLFKYIGSVWRKLEPTVECIEIKGKIGGRIGDPVKIEERVSTESKPARDVIAGKESYSYGGFSEGSGIEEVAEDEDFLKEDEDTDESFWNDIFNESKDD